MMKMMSMTFCFALVMGCSVERPRSMPEGEVPAAKAVQPVSPLAQLPLAVGMEREKVEKLVAEATGSTSQYHVYTMHAQREARYTNGTTVLSVKFKSGAPAPWVEATNGALQHLPPLDATVESWELKSK